MPFELDPQPKHMSFVLVLDPFPWIKVYFLPTNDPIARKHGIFWNGPIFLKSHQIKLWSFSNENEYPEKVKVNQMAKVY